MQAHDPRTLEANKRKHIFMGLFLAVAVMIPHRTLAAAPSVDNANGASNVLSISAVLSGTLISTGGLPTQVYAYWGDIDGGTAFGNWGHTNNLGTNIDGPLSLGVTNLTPNQVYYYRFYATNHDGVAWASTTTNFQTLAAAGPAPVNLGSTAHFMILAGSAITQPTTGGTINGDIGLSPAAGSFIGIPPVQVNGTIHAVDATGTQAPNVVIDPTNLTTAKGDLTIAFNDAAGRTPIPTGSFLNPGLIPGSGNIGGMNLVPGLYKFDTSTTAYITGSDLTLTGGPDDVWIFQCGRDLEVGSGIHVILAGGARAKNIFWQVGTSATLGTGSTFKGTIIADQAITMNTTSTIEGRALAFTAGVAFSGNGGSLPTPDAPTFTQISRTGTNSDTVVLSTTPYLFLTLQTSPNLFLTNWTTITTDTPVTNQWTFLHNTALTGATQCFYRAFIKAY